MYGEVPPLGNTVASPSQAAKHVALFDAIEATRAVGSVTTTTSVPMQPTLSVTVATYVPATRPVALALV